MKKYIYEAIIGVQSTEKGGLFKVKEGLETLDKNVKKAVGMENVSIYLLGSPKYRLVTWSFKPETIKKKVIPIVNETIKKLSKQKGLKVVLLEENLKVGV